MRQILSLAGVAIALVGLLRCGLISTCTLTDNTTATSTTNSYGCAILTRDTSICQTSRTAQGLSGYWLKFSCRVTLTKSDSNVIVTTDGQPDYKSQYFASTDACYQSESNSGRIVNPNTISVKNISMTVPMIPPTTPTGGSTMNGAVVGIALNGVAIFGNFAAPGDDIYQEAQTFDKCEGHPQNTGTYHYHSEPASISDQDAYFIGVMRDGYPIYGRYDSGNNTPSLDSSGGHSGTTVDSNGSFIYHYHVNLQTAGTPSQYFITKGTYAGSIGTCTGCN